jgi:predicted nucleic acid-binding protein
VACGTASTRGTPAIPARSLIPTAYVDTSALVAVQFGEPTRPAYLRTFRAQTRLLTTTLAQAELCATIVRAKQPLEAAERLLRRVEIFVPPDDLAEECREALGYGYLRGADLWHVAAAMRLAGPHRKRLTFCTGDGDQATIARAVGLAVFIA